MLALVFSSCFVSFELLFLGSRPVIHSMEAIVGYSQDKSWNMVLLRGLTKHVPITETAFFFFLLGILSLRFWSKDEILNDIWLVVKP